ncbi:MAG: hypothetical protein JNL74_16585, partial [Fibrobacteres bacterium]|nr:hypothetical protein [Fibrobacterota bacterium]
MENINLILDQLPLDNRSLYLLHDNNGVVIKVLSYRESTFRFIIEEIESNGGLSAFFDFNSFNVADSKNTLSLKKEFEHYTFFYRIHTSLPQAS